MSCRFRNSKLPKAASRTSAWQKINSAAVVWPVGTIISLAEISVGCVCSSVADSYATASKSSYENSRPMQAAIWATRFAPRNLSSCAVRMLCRLCGMALLSIASFRPTPNPDCAIAPISCKNFSNFSTNNGTSSVRSATMSSSCPDSSDTLLSALANTSCTKRDFQIPGSPRTKTMRPCAASTGTARKAFAL